MDTIKLTHTLNSLNKSVMIIMVKVKLSPFTPYTIMGSRSIAPLILNLSIVRRLEVNLRSRPSFLRKITPLTIKQKAAWTPYPVWKVWRKEKFMAPARIRTPNPPTRSQVTIQKTLIVHILFHLKTVASYFPSTFSTYQTSMCIRERFENAHTLCHFRKYYFIDTL